jgi:BirA family biotin operon repressor/biotin-[acetyl-CoA-carboxylase] ligase
LASIDFDIDALRLALGDRLVGHRLAYHERVTSTMDEARKIVEAGGEEGTVVIAEDQTAARGRFDRPWIAPPGENLYFSVVLKPALDQLPYANMAAALAVARAVSSIGGLRPTIKWPNDVRISGRKLCGILVEAELESRTVPFAIVGVGLNVNFDPSRYPEIATTATSIYRETGRRTDRTLVLQSVLEYLDDLYGGVKDGLSLTADWAAMLDTLGRDVEVRWKESVVKGRADSVDDQGNLVLTRPDGSTFKATAGEVTFQL